ncbi:hypothetical protein RUND412_001630 [Rhizina undulata]
MVFPGFHLHQQLYGINMREFEDKIALTIHTAYVALPKKCKPRANEWVPLSGIVLEAEAGELTCVALSFLLTELQKILLDPTYTSQYLLRRPESELTPTSPQPFTIRPSLRIHFYTSEAPCGDASMETLMSGLPDSTPWAIPTSNTVLRGRGYFSELGVLRTKPGRADSPPTLSKSCTDKLSLRQFTSTLLTPVAALISPSHGYLSTLTLPISEHNAVSTTRAFSATGRLRSLAGRTWDGGYAFRPFVVGTTGLEFEFSRRGRDGGGDALKGSNVSAVFVRGRGVETIIGGVLQGRKQFSGARAGSWVCKSKLWGMAVEVAGLLGAGWCKCLCKGSYEEVKAAEEEVMSVRRKVKADVREVLRPWVRNGGDGFAL